MTQEKHNGFPVFHRIEIMGSGKQIEWQMESACLIATPLVGDTIMSMLARLDRAHRSVGLYCDCFCVPGGQRPKGWCLTRAGAIKQAQREMAEVLGGYSACVSHVESMLADLDREAERLADEGESQ